MNKQDRYELLANSIPVNRQAAIVTSQVGCESGLYINTDKEKLKALGLQKRHYAEEVILLKREMRIKPNWNKKSLPMWILNHPKYQYFMDLRNTLAKLDIEITELNRKVKPQDGARRFENDFIAIVKEKYPQIYEEIRVALRKKYQESGEL